MCYGLTSPLNNGQKVHGKYCLGSISFEAFAKANKINIAELWSIINRSQNVSSASLEDINLPTFKYGYCFPSSCSVQDIHEIVNSLITFVNINNTITFDEDNCYSKDSLPDLTNGAVFTM